MVLFGLSGLSVNFVAGLILTGIGILLTTAGHSETVLSCPGCGTQGATVGDFARQPGPAGLVKLWRPKPELIASTISVLLVAVGVLIWLFALRA